MEAYAVSDPIQAFRALPDDARAELYNGEIVMMDSPLDDHQGIGADLFYQLYFYLRGKECFVRADMDVQLDTQRPTIVRPDIFVVCDTSKRRDGRIYGAPDLVIEILSPSSRRRDMIRKFNLYLQAGVREYWIVDPDEQTVSQHMLRDGHYMTNVYEAGERIEVDVLEGCIVDLSTVFPQTGGDQPVSES